MMLFIWLHKMLTDSNSVSHSRYPLYVPIIGPLSLFYESLLTISGASTIPAFLSLVCTIFPILFYYYGPRVRRSCKYSKEADDFMDKIKGRSAPPPAVEGPVAQEQVNEGASSEHESIVDSEKRRTADLAGLPNSDQVSIHSHDLEKG